MGHINLNKAAEKYEYRSSKKANEIKIKTRGRYFQIDVVGGSKLSRLFFFRGIAIMIIANSARMVAWL